MALLILALLQRIFLMSSLMLLLVWLIFFMVLIKLLPILGTISGKTVKLMVLALIRLGDNRQDFFFQAEDCIRDVAVTGVQTCALPILRRCSDVRNHGGGNSAGRSAASSKHRLTGTIGTPRYGRWCPLLPFSEGGSHALPRLAPRTLVRAVRTCAVRSAGRAGPEGPAPRSVAIRFPGR